MLRSAWEDINDNRRRSYAGNQSYNFDPSNYFDKPSLLSPEVEQKVRTGRQKAKENAKANAGNILGNSNNHSRNEARAVREAEENRGGFTPENIPENKNEEVPPSFERMGNTKCSDPS